MTRRLHPLVVIGGGPAGIAAAIEAARAGLTCMLVDEAARLGGQIYRQPSQDFRVQDPRALGKEFVHGERLRAEFEEIADRVAVRCDTSILAVSGEREVLWGRDGRTGLIGAPRLIIATGAYERPVPFPGWTLPGVMAAGGVQTLIKTMQVRPARRALVAGTGPLIFGAARRLHEVGVEVAAVLEAGSSVWPNEALLKAWRGWDFVQNAWENVQSLRRARIPILLNHTVFEAHGRQEVEAASFGAVDSRDWRPLKGTAQTEAVDLVCVSFGFVPNTELSVLAGCRQQYVDEVGGWVPVRDAMMRTTVPGIFAVGDGAGVGGAAAAVEEGRVAGITAAEEGGTITANEAARRRAAPLDRLRSLARAREALKEASRIRPGLLDLATPQTLVCRCEEVCLAEVRAALDAGARDLQAVKLLTRLGMGPCQGRNCAPAMGLYVSHATGRTPEHVGRINPRPPVKPVTLGALAKMAEVNP